MQASVHPLQCRAIMTPLPPEELQKILDKFQAWHERVSATGKIKAGQPLVREGKILSQKNGQIVDGPFTESKEAIGGYCLLTASSLEEAVAVVKGFPGWNTEIRSKCGQSRKNVR